jgi:hypothetical protein
MSVIAGDYHVTDLSKYQEMKATGKNAADAYASTKADGLNQLTGILVLREVYGLSLIDAKRVIFEVDTGQSSEVPRPDLQKQYIDVLDDLLGDYEKPGEN